MSYWFRVATISVGLLVGALLLGLWLDRHASDVARVFLTTWGSILSFPATLVGTLLSALAVYEVRRLSSRYVGRERLPEIQKSLAKDLAAYLKTAEAPLSELATCGLVPRMAANVRSISGYAVSNQVKKSAKGASGKLKTLKNQMSSQKSKGTTACSALDSFWPAFEALQELSTDVDNYVKDERKRQNVH